MEEVAILELFGTTTGFGIAHVFGAMFVYRLLAELLSAG
jgi:hypothetical protein